MAELKTEHIFDASVADTLAGIRRYDRYPEYLPGVQAIRVLPAAKPESSCQVRYDLKFIKTFYYILNMFESATKVHWHLDESNIMRISNGSWELNATNDGRTRAIYSLEIQFKGIVPQRIVDQITKANLPAMFRGFQRLIDDSKG